jgi:hypothetical protein
MKSRVLTLSSCLKITLLLVMAHQPVFAGDYLDNISEDYLRTVFEFAEGDQLKHAECKKNSYPTCTYVWGVESDKDAARAKYGLAPDGNKLMIIYAQARSASDFQRVLGTYSDAEEIDGLGEQAIWSQKRKQLLLITDESLILHVNIDEKEGKDLKAKALTIARHLLEMPGV